MIKYLKLFETHVDYNTYINSQDKVLPNVSYCKNENEVHYNPYTDPRLITKFNVVDDSEPTKIYGGLTDSISVVDAFIKIEVDGIEISLTDLDENNGYYQLSEGEHTIKYTLIDPTETGDSVLYDCSCLTSVTIPNSVITINRCSFQSCSGLTNVTIGNSVTTIDTYAFQGCAITNIVMPNTITNINELVFNGCSELTNITSLATTAPTIHNSTFQNVKSSGTLTVPTGSTGYDVWMGTGNYYLGKYNWTKVEQ